MRQRKQLRITNIQQHILCHPFGVYDGMKHISGAYAPACILSSLRDLNET